MLKILLPYLALLLPFYTVYNKKWMYFSLYMMISPIFFLLFFFPFSTSSFFVNSFFYIDYLNSPLIILTSWISFLMIVSSFNVLINKKSPSIFIMFVFVLNFILILTFLQSNILMFYFLFESSLIPTMLLIIGWGYQPERLQASFYFIIYTVTASLPLLISILLIFNKNLSLSFNNEFWVLPTKYIYIWWFFSIFAFLVKMPMFLTHLWLPKAHVEAPVAGSMILAAILLKLGSYGLLRVSSMFFMMNKNIMGLISSISLIGAFITSIICIRQPDMKSLIAYSSVGHMGLLIAGLLSNSIWGWEGVMMLMIAHGLTSSMMFSLANSIYETSNSRSLFLNKGMMSYFPIMTLFWFLASAANMAAPPTMNLSSEIFLLTSILFNSNLFFIFLGFVSFLAAVYSLYLFTSIQHGNSMNYSNSMNLFLSRNYSLSIFHLIPIFLMILKPEFIIIFSYI